MLRLYVDESGSKDFNDPHSENFILCGVIFDAAHETYIRHYAQFVKQKHFGTIRKLFHSNEILKPKALGLKTNRTDFYKDLMVFLGASRFEVIFVSIHKPSYKKKGFRSINVHHDAYLTLYKAFLRRVVTKAQKNRDNRGQICLEQSQISGDLEIHKLYNEILSGKWSRYGFDSRLVRKYIVSLKFVTKNNYDTEVQIADILAYSYAKYLSKNYSDSAQEELLQNIVNLAKKRRFIFTDFETGKRKNSFIDIR